MKFHCEIEFSVCVTGGLRSDSLGSSSDEEGLTQIGVSVMILRSDS